MARVHSFVDPGDFAEVGDEVVYHGDQANLVLGLVADHAISPLTGVKRYRVVDSRSEADDPEAGRWVSHDQLYSISSPGRIDEAFGI